MMHTSKAKLLALDYSVSKAGTIMNDMKHILHKEWPSIFLILSAALILIIGSAKLPGPEYDPLGPAGLPRLIGFLLLMMLVAHLLVVCFKQRSTSVEDDQKTKNVIEFKRPLSCAALTFIYLIAISAGLFPFEIVTVFYLTLVGYCMAHFSIRKLPVILVIAVTVGVGLSYIFSHVLNIVLPG